MPFALARLWRTLLRSVRSRPGRTAAAIFVLLLASLFGNAVAFWWFDGQLDPGIGLGDALWYSIISVTTIGYGDFSATTAPARWATVIAIAFVGLPVFSMFIGVVAEQVVSHHEKERRGLLPVDDQNHMLILNCPSGRRVRDIAREFRADTAFHGKPVYLVTDVVDTNPVSAEEIGFVQGSPIDEEKLRRANIDRADTVIILSPDYGSTNSDAQVAAALTLCLNDLFQVCRKYG
ncbi:potassium channel protein [Thiohalorhabdus sp. Cl-TMA]|uniref:Potassium channel family protein n=1 Tax=Thiohalorhabdus methylotrophus TaxID=3242694 RepID=A0ABV4U1G6_9GAMM